MTKQEEQDAHRWTTYEALCKEGSGAAPAEVAQAAKHLAALRLKYPKGKPGAVPPVDPWMNANDWFNKHPWNTASGYNTWAGTTPDPEAAAKAKAEREAREAKQREETRLRAIQQQRNKIEGTPDWWSVEALRELHRAESAWSTEDKVRLNEVARHQWEMVEAHPPDVYARLTKLWEAGAAGDVYHQAQVGGILRELIDAGCVLGPRLHAGHWNWLRRLTDGEA